MSRIQNQTRTRMDFEYIIEVKQKVGLKLANISLDPQFGMELE